MKVKLNQILTCCAVSIAIASCTENSPQKESDDLKTETIEAPDAKMIAEKLEAHGDTRIDNYFWMRLSDEQKEREEATRDAQTQDVLDYLNEENEYTKANLEHTEKFQEKLFDEIVGRMKQTDMSVPYKLRGYYYFNRYEEGQDYALYCRKKGSLEAEEEIMLNGPEMGKDQNYFAIGGASVSPDNKMIAYGVDLISRRVYTVYFKNLETGELLEDQLIGTTGGATWAEDGKTLFYSKKDEVTLRTNQIYSHTLGTPQSEDKLVYQEDDETFNCFAYKTKSRKFIVIGSSSTVSQEYRFVDAKTPNAEFRMIEPRKRDLEYGLAHFGDHFYIATNADGATNFKLMKAPVTSPGKENWEEVLPHREDVLLEGVDMFRDFMVVDERKGGLSQLRVKSWDGKTDYYMEFDDPAYVAWTGSNPDFDTDVLRFGYSSLTTPVSTFDYDMVNKSRVLLKQQEVVGGYNVEDYKSERVIVSARDGVEVPISLVYKKGMKKDGKTPLLLYGYGSYGNTIDPYFNSARLSLLDRGFVFAIAHIRGGQEMGRSWYENGKMFNKMNTFNDFIDCGKHLVKENYTSEDHLYAMGGSAGGLLMGAVINMEPKMWNGVIAAVPFVDVVSTMMDETIPLTTGEFDEWGNPKIKEQYDYIKAYSPYDNIQKLEYPNMLVTTGYWDSQVQYWEPAKWVAKLRDEKVGDKKLYLFTNMEAGHGGASGRFRAQKEKAMEYAFFLDLEGIQE